MLYYAVTNWGYYNGLPKNQPITSGPYTNWNPIVSWTDKYNGYLDGDGQLYCAGPPNVGPLPTIRLENIRDGLEDYEYLWMLAELEGNVEKARAACEPVTTGLTTFTRDPKTVYATRDRIARRIEALLRQRR